MTWWIMFLVLSVTRPAFPVIGPGSLRARLYRWKSTGTKLVESSPVGTKGGIPYSGLGVTWMILHPANLCCKVESGDHCALEMWEATAAATSPEELPPPMIRTVFPAGETLSGKRSLRLRKREL